MIDNTKIGWGRGGLHSTLHLLVPGLHDDGNTTISQIVANVCAFALTKSSLDSRSSNYPVYDHFSPEAGKVCYQSKVDIEKAWE